MRYHGGYRGSIKRKAKLLNSTINRMHEINRKISLWMETNNIILLRSYLILLINSFLNHLLHNNFGVLFRAFLVFHVKYHCNKTTSAHFHFVKRLTCYKKILNFWYQKVKTFRDIFSQPNLFLPTLLDLYL